MATKLTRDMVIASRDSVQLQLDNLQKKIAAYDPMTVTLQQLTIDLNKTSKFEIQLDDIRSNLYTVVTTPDEVKAEEIELAKLDDQLEKTRLKVLELQAPIPIIPIRTPNPVRLERLKIPTFNGNYENWQSFHDMFQSMVHNNTSISGSEKLTYLQQALTGAASTVICSYEPTDANYDEAWAHLKKRYAVKREIIFAHIKSFEDFRPKHSDPDCGLRSIADCMNKTIRTLRVQSVPVEHWDVILVYLALKKLDPVSRQQWSLDLTTELPTVTDFVDYIEKRARALTTSSQPKAQSSVKPHAVHHAAKAGHGNKKKSCMKCSGEHALVSCPDFNKFSISEKYKFLKEYKMCTNCIRPSHSADVCRSDTTCSTCGKKHHSSLHRSVSFSGQASAGTPATTTTSSSHCAIGNPKEQVVLLGTLLVDVKDVRGVPQQCRVFVDNGSESHFVSEHCINRLGLKRKTVNVPLNGIGNEPGPICKAQVQLKIHSRTEPYFLDINALVLPKFAGLIPATKCQSQWSHLDNITLSDPKFFSPHFTDILLGAAKSGHIMLPEIITHPTNPEAPVALNTRFGFMVNGESPAVRTIKPPRSIHHATVSRSQTLDDLLVKFWEQDQPETRPKPLSSSDIECEKHFLDTHSVNSDGTYTVQLPFRPDAPTLGRSREAAVKRFISVEKRLSTKPEIKEEYVKSIREYISLGYLEPIPEDEIRKSPSMSFYLPHHEVVKESSSSTKVRPVFDASLKTTNKVSLNDTLYTGPKLQVDLSPLILRFIPYPIVMSADIWKFYPQTSAHHSHRDFQRLVWREEPEQPLKDYRMTRVTFGVSAAPYLAIRAFHQLAEKVKTTHPDASQVIKEEFLVDNLLSGAHTLDQAIQLKTELLNVMNIGGLRLLKFMSNSTAFLDTIPTELRDPASFHSIDEGDFVKTIGILWNPTLDVFSVKVKLPEAPTLTTKRTVLSTIARTFDPQGWLSPVTVTPKIFMQELWKAGLGWDEPLPLQFHQSWRKYCEELPVLQDFSLPRNAFAAPAEDSTSLTHQLHGFSDGSDTAHAACVYVRTQDLEGRAAVKLLTAKTKVNPINKTTTPRSELCGALLLSTLMSTVCKAIKTEFSSIHCWTDSTVVLGRLSTEKKLPAFELNRIRQIMLHFPKLHWNHVKGEENPADAPSRGISPDQLLDHPLWLHGPEWLQTFVPEDQPTYSAVAAVQPTPVTDFLLGCSSFAQMKIRIAYVLCFVRNLRKPRHQRQTRRLSPAELNSAQDAIIRVVQRGAFPDQIRRCSDGLQLKGRLNALTPFIGSDSILRVGGRLENADIPYQHKHPALLPKNHHVVDVMAKHFHEAHLHAGPTLLLAIIREQFWPMGGLHLTKRVVRTCVTCHKYQAATATQIMGQLPAARVNQAPPFSQAGVDYAGPFQMALRTGRKPPLIKAYVALFVCMATKATHLELVSDLTSAAFIAALNRFISRRGLPNDVYSDEGTNFVGAKRDLDELLEFVNSAAHIDAVKDFLAPKGVTFHTNPPSSPHHGGLWEAAVKSMKFHLRRVMGTRNLTVEEFSTLLCQVEAMLNSRPITPLSNDPNDMAPLTPGHFLIGRPLTALPYPDLGHVPVSQLDRWQTVQCVIQHIWESWKRSYLSLLQSRPKWQAPTPNLEPGTMVLIMDKDASLGPQQWKLGRIVEVFPGADEKTRVCTVRTNVTAKNPKGTILRRPVVKLAPLPNQ